MLVKIEIKTKTNDNSPTYILHHLLPISNLIIYIVPPKKKLKMVARDRACFRFPPSFPVTPPKVQSISLKPRRRRRSAEANNLQAQSAVWPENLHTLLEFFGDVMMVSKPTNLLRPPEKSVMNGGRVWWFPGSGFDRAPEKTQMTGWEVFPTFFSIGNTSCIHGGFSILSCLFSEGVYDLRIAPPSKTSWLFLWIFQHHPGSTSVVFSTRHSYSDATPRHSVHGILTYMLLMFVVNGKRWKTMWFLRDSKVHDCKHLSFRKIWPRHAKATRKMIM